MGVALTTAIRELSTLIATPLPQGVSNPSLTSALTRFGIFLLLSIRWTLGILWYFDRVYISKNPPTLGVNYFFDFFKALINFLVFVPLAIAVTASSSTSPLATWMNTALVGGKPVSTFVWILLLILFYDLIFFLLKCGLWLVLKEVPLRIHIFWAILNFLTLIFCMLVYLLSVFRGSDPQAAAVSAEIPIFYIILFATLIDLVGTVIEDSPLSKFLSPQPPAADPDPVDLGSGVTDGGHDQSTTAAGS
jgi:hypothetical protein